jgi:hypothetical protein
MDIEHVSGEKKVPRRRPDHDTFQEVRGEVEADAVGEAILREAGPDVDVQAAALTQADASTAARAAGSLQRTSGNAHVQRIAERSGEGAGRLVGLSQSAMTTEVARRSTGGANLDDGLRGEMERKLGSDFADVRVHDDESSAALSHDLGAAAFTVGKDVFLGEHAAPPTSPEGRATLAHELTHVGQQAGGAPAVQRQAIDEEKPEEEKKLLAPEKIETKKDVIAMTAEELKDEERRKRGT